MRESLQLGPSARVGRLAIAQPLMAQRMRSAIAVTGVTVAASISARVEMGRDLESLQSLCFLAGQVPCLVAGYFTSQRTAVRPERGRQVVALL